MLKLFGDADTFGQVQRQARTPYPMRRQLPFSKVEQLSGRVRALAAWPASCWPVLARFVREVNQYAPRFQPLSDAQLRAQAVELTYRLKARAMAREVVAETFALVREAAGRALGKRHYDVQLAGGWAMLGGRVVEMQTGEGKTLCATLPACAAALAGIPVHVITVNDYLAERDAESLHDLYAMLGLTCSAALARMSEAERRNAYRNDVVYTTNKQVAFDHLRDRIKMHSRGTDSGLGLPSGQESDLLLRGLQFAIVDEADSVLVDEAATPLIISRRGRSRYAPEMLRQALDLAKVLEEGDDFRIKWRERDVMLLPAGQRRLKGWSGGQHGLWRNTHYREHLVGQALRASFLFERGRHYLVDEGSVKIVDEFTGRLMADRSWEHGLHQLIEMKEGCEVTGEMETIGRISYQAFFRRYLMLAGMSGTVREVAGELLDVYGLRIARIPTHRPSQRRGCGASLAANAQQRWERVVERVRELAQQGRPVLVGTRSVAASEQLSALLTAAGVGHRVLNARQDAAEAEIIAAAGTSGQVTVATNMAGRGTDILLEAGVAELGGLHVIATEMHEARRVDRQLFGRCGRQGDPGSFEQLAALDDDLFRAHSTGVRLALARAALGLSGHIGEVAALALVSAAQQRAEAAARRSRARVQKIDEYLGNVLAFTGRLE